MSHKLTQLPLPTTLIMHVYQLSSSILSLKTISTTHKLPKNNLQNQPVSSLSLSFLFCHNCWLRQILMILACFAQWVLKWLWWMKSLFLHRSLPPSLYRCLVKVKRKRKKNPSAIQVTFFTKILNLSLMCFLWAETGITDIEIHFLQIKFTAIGVYIDTEVVGHLQQWKGKPGNQLAEDDDFFDALIAGA